MKWKKKIGVVMLLGMVFVLFGCGTKSSPEKVAIKACETTLNSDMEAYYKLLAPPYQEYMIGEDGWYKDDVEFREELLDWSQEHRDDIINRCGSNYKFECEIKDVKNCTADNLESVKTELEDYGYDSNQIKDAAIATVLIHASGPEGKGSWTSEESCVKIGGSWYLHRPGFDTF
ncbi:MAG: hypothetical protein Q4B56_08450 [Erysipelotrichaceae bacterium]|nr:hypothetical protein [Erysipelotrichaceae bacterium]